MENIEIDNNKHDVKQQLIRAAYQAMDNAYAPYSKYKVGAAVLTEDGCIYSGCNIENASFGASNCAERTAIFKAVSEGHTQISQIAVVSSAHNITPPCGICRQVMLEFAADDFKIILTDDRRIYIYNMQELLPLGFELEFPS